MKFYRFRKIQLGTRMHSSRMCTVRCSSRLSCHACPPATHTPATHAPLSQGVSISGPRSLLGVGIPGTRSLLGWWVCPGVGLSGGGYPPPGHGNRGKVGYVQGGGYVCLWVSAPTPTFYTQDR